MFFSCQMQKHPLEVFYKKLFLKISQNSEENTAPELESIFNKFEGLKDCKVTSAFLLCEIFRNTYFDRIPPVAASDTHAAAFKEIY